MSTEWQYLFSEAGVTEEMLQDKATLQFILDTVYEIGGAPQELPSKCRWGYLEQLFVSASRFPIIMAVKCPLSEIFSM